MDKTRTTSTVLFGALALALLWRCARPRGERAAQGREGNSDGGNCPPGDPVLVDQQVGGAGCKSCTAPQATRRPTPPAHPQLRGRRDLLPTYAPDHWCKTPLRSDDAGFVAVLEVSGAATGEPPLEVLVLEAGAQGYAAIVALTDRKDMTQPFSRVPTPRQYEAVLLAAAQVAAAFLRLGMLPQVEFLTNNSHRFVPGEKLDRKGDNSSASSGTAASSAGCTGGVLELGNTREPFVPHAHITGRGDPGHCYIPGVPLRGGVPYEVMVPRARKEEWGGAGERAAVADGLAASLEALDLHPDVHIKEHRSRVVQGL